MKLFFAFFLFLTSSAFGSIHITLPPEGVASAESIRQCESQVSMLDDFKRTTDGNTVAYSQMNSGADSFVYFFTSSSEASHPAMIKVIIHPMLDPRNPKRDDVAFYESYSGNEDVYVEWRKRILFDFGRGFASGAIQAAKKVKH